MAAPFKFLPFLLLALFTFSVSSELIAMIDCGGSDIESDSSDPIPWTPDDFLISNGIARVVKSSNSISPAMDTLRVFTTRKKNCYIQSVTQGEKVMVRAWFHYGNYDGLSNPPTFDLHFDGNFWTTVETSISEVKRYEAIYVAKRDEVSVCVAQTKPNQFPFMSALEISTFDSDAYSDLDENRALFLIKRFAFGASETIRYSEDVYDRIWEPNFAGTKKVASDAFPFSPTGPNNPPFEILQNAITVDSVSDALYLGTVLPSQPPLYVAMYFSEVSDLDSTQTRSFRIYETSTTGSGPLQLPIITPPYGDVVVQDLNNYTVDSVTNISLVATGDSTFPPLINALESFNISGVLTDGTDSNDVAALALLKTSFEVLEEWTGDPCLPAPYSWDWLNCSSDATPRVTALYLDSFNLLGIFPDISSMDALEFIDLHNNSLTGPIPSFFGTMPNLKQLNLAYNDFSGSIPTSLKNKVNVTGNPLMCTSGKSCSSSSGTLPGSSPGTKSKKSNSLPVILGTTIPAFFLVWVVAGVFIILRKRRKPTYNNTTIATGGGANGVSNGLHQIGEETVHEMVENVVQQAIGSPSPLLGN